MDLAFHSIHFSPMFGASVPLVDTLAAAQSAGFGHIGLDVPSIEEFLDTGASLEDLRDALTAHDLTCTDLVVLVVGPDRRAALDRAERISEIAAIIRPELCVLAVAEPVDWADLVTTVRDCASLLSSVGVRLAVEYSAYTHLSNLGDAYRLCDEVGWERAGVLLDSLHVFRAGTSWEELAALRSGQVSMVQFSDALAVRPADLVDDSRNARRLPGDGELPLRQFVRAVRATGFDGPVAPEVLSSAVRQGDPGQFAHAIHRALVEYWTDDPPA